MNWFKSSAVSPEFYKDSGETKSSEFNIVWNTRDRKDETVYCGEYFQQCPRKKYTIAKTTINPRQPPPHFQPA
jgi:hypothetical protein